MIGKLYLAAVMAVGLMAGTAHADSITMNGFPLNGTIGGPGGTHTITIDGVTCTVKNSTQGPNTGCNYTITGGVNGQGSGTINVTPQQAPGVCSVACGQ
jgi:hypothetical protein